ncbi:MAG: ketopantoate reductase family protein [Spirochaetia bacterium]
MEIMIVGPGAVGTLLGGLLGLSGHHVTLLGRKPPENPGIPVRIVLPQRWLLAEGVRCAGPGEHVGESGAYLVTMGRHHLHAARRPDVLRLVGTGDAPVAFFNSDPAEPVRLAVPVDRVRLCLTLMNAVKLQAADVELTTDRPVIIFERSPVLGQLFRNLAGFGFQAVPVDDARPFLNSFLITQLLFLPVAMCNTTLNGFLATEGGRELASSILSEGFAAMERAGMPLAPLPLMDPRELAARLEKKPDSFESVPPSPGREYNSVLQSLLRGRPTEAAQLNKRMVEIASSAGLHLTWNWRILQKASRVASIGFYRDPSELLRSLA